MYNNGENIPTPYKASGNLNTSIGNPSMDVNNTMQVNIQSVNSNISNNNANNGGNSVVPKAESISASNQNVQVTPKTSTPPNNYASSSSDSKENEIKKPYIPNQNSTGQSKSKVKMGPEVRFAFLIVVLLIIFVLLLPMISKFVTGE